MLLRTFTTITALSPKQELTTSLRKRLQYDLIDALKAKDTFKSNLIRQLQADLLRQEKEGSVKKPEEDPLKSQLAYLQSSADRWRDTIAEYTRLLGELEGKEGGLQDRLPQIRQALEKEMAELAFIQRTYLPPGYSREELADLLDFQSLPRPLTMSAAMGRLAGKVDFSRISKKHLSQLVMKMISNSYLS